MYALKVQRQCGQCYYKMIAEKGIRGFRLAAC